MIAEGAIEAESQKEYLQTMGNTNYKLWADERQLLREIQELTSRQFVYEDGRCVMVPFNGRISELHGGPPVPFAKLTWHEQADVLREFIHWDRYPERAPNDHYRIQENLEERKPSRSWLEGTSLRQLFHQPKDNAMGKKNYDNLMELLGGQDYRRIEVQGYMPLVIERLEGLPIISLTHYGTQNGDLMRDPECCFLIAGSTAQAVYFRNDYAGIEHATVGGHFGDVPVKPDLQKDLQSFVSMWWTNLREQGFFERARELLEQDKAHERERDR
jgi:hypothetical protein